MQSEKKQIIMHYEKSILWLERLSDVTDKQWRLPIQQGKWTVAEVIGHLSPWDEFVLHERIPFLSTQEQMPKGPNVEQMNDKAASISRLQSMEQTLQALLKNRRLLLEAIVHLTDELWQQRLQIGRSELTLYSYFSGLVEHDRHHFSQVQNVIGEMEWK
ncbi:DinB family protein [Lysinibacillus sp. CD3-6]|uniref:DinB family protein n=1 Tax=Lysinibacillus sp. CD3-6 TaxID=2892541 RepID=UPI0011200FCA|nr:DinB family protein [Lysinibacillus sp. CD3-6]UED80093.1 DinB family protein [Lysinibacillus sp. CD3-6]